MFAPVALALSCAALASAQPPWPTPLPWPVQHTHREVQYTPGSQNFANKQVAYDFPNRALRYDITYLSGPLTPFVTLMNFTSLWLNDTLYMITYEAYLDKTPQCIALSMGCVLRHLPRLQSMRAQHPPTHPQSPPPTTTLNNAALG